jgi:hypothetical protein
MGIGSADPNRLSKGKKCMDNPNLLPYNPPRRYTVTPSDFRNVHLTLVKSALEKSFAQKPIFLGFWAKTFLGTLFTKIKFTVLKSV